MDNPFREIVKADELTPRLATRLFVEEASPIWLNIQHPLNHLIVGPRGAGKTIALRQLDHRTQQLQQEPPKHLGLYVQISRLSAIFRSPFANASQGNDSTNTVLFQRIFSDCVWLEIVKGLAESLKSNLATVKLRNDTIFRLTGIQARSLDALVEYCLNKQRAIDEKIHSWAISNEISWEPIADLPNALQRCANALREIMPFLSADRPCLYLLFDESSPIPLECQEVLNCLLHRGRPYCVKLAVRPYEWESLRTATHAQIELDTDLFPLHIRYPNELEDDYVCHMESVIRRVLQTQAVGPSSQSEIDHIFPVESSSEYSGFRSICAASSGNPQNLLQICACIFQATDYANRLNEKLIFPANLQDQAIRAWSKDYEDRNPYTDSRAFCRALLKRVRGEKNKPIGFSYSHDDPNLFAPEYLPDSVGKQIKSAFSGGFLRSSNPSRTSLFEVSSEFHISRGLLPGEDLSLSLPITPSTAIDDDFVQYSVRDRASMRRTTKNLNNKVYKAFLSTSFSQFLRQQRIDIKRCLQNVGVRCSDVEDNMKDQFLFSSIYKQIKATDITILDATILRPYTMFEIGLCAGVSGKPKGVICIVNEEGKKDAISELPEFIKSLPVLTFSSSNERLKLLAAEVLTRTRELIEAPSEFATVYLTKMSLRPRRRSNNVLYVSLPDYPIRQRALEQIRLDLEKKGWEIIIEEDADAHATNEFQVPIYCAHLCRIAVIDTSGQDQPDLLQSYKLGLFAGKNAPWRVLQVEKKEMAKRGTFSSVPGIEYFAWNELDELVSRVERFVSGNGNSRRR